MIAALIPVKGLEQSKSRLLSYLPSEGRNQLTLAMLEDLIEALSRTRGVDRIAVTTPDRIVAEHAQRAGAEVLIRPEPGLNAALEDGIERLRLHATDGLLIVLGDVAGACAEDFDQLIERAARTTGPGLWLAPSSDGGTSALLKRPPNIVPSVFGRESADRHREEASKAAIPFESIPLESLAIDLDHPADLDAFLETKGGGRRTRAVLADLLPAAHDSAPNATPGEKEDR